MCVACVRPLAGGVYCAACYTPRYRRRALIRRVLVTVAALSLVVGGYLLFEKKKRENRERERYGAHRQQIEKLQLALAGDVCSTGTATRLARLLAETRHLSEARQTLKQVVESCPPNETVLSELAGIHRQLGDIDEALLVAEALIGLRPRNADGYALRGELSRELGRQEAALRDFQRAFGFDPTGEEVARSLAGLLEAHKQPCQAAVVIDELLGRSSLDSRAGLRERSDQLRKRGGCPRERVEGGKVFVPFEMHQDVMVVQVRINDKITARMLLDTGASSLALTRALANRLALDLSKSKTVMVATAGGATTATRVMLDSVALGGARLEKVRAAVVEAMWLADAEGLLGNSFLSRFEVTVDTANSRVVLEPRRERSSP